MNESELAEMTENGTAMNGLAEVGGSKRSFRRPAAVSPVLGSVVNTASTTAWGNARPLDVTLRAIASSTSAAVVELSIGALPVMRPDEVLNRFRGRGMRFIGHHAMPVGDGRMVRPEVGDERLVSLTCERFGLSSYSGHPPNRKFVDWQGMLSWAASYHEMLAAAGVGFSVETMYVPQVRQEAMKTGGYHLATPAEVFEFCEWAENKLGWEQPLLVDASHLHIGYRCGDWTEQQIVELMESRWVAELHISENDGKADSHRPLTAKHVVHDWVCRADTSHIPVIVDEGRRRRR